MNNCSKIVHVLPPNLAYFAPWRESIPLFGNFRLHLGITTLGAEAGRIPIGEYAARLASLGRVDIDSPGDTEFVREPADVGAARLLRQRHLDPALFGKCVEDFGEAGFICAAQ